METNEAHICDCHIKMVKILIEIISLSSLCYLFHPLV